MAVVSLVLVLLAVTAGLEVLARAVKVPLPGLLVVAGVIVALIPGVPRPELDPEAVFMVFIPPLLYWTALTSSIRDFRRWFFSITLLAVGLVLATTAAVAAVAHALVPELTWPSAFLLGAIVSPPDPVAALAVIRNLRVPRAIVTILEGEGLVNDATALVAFRMAIAATAASAEAFSVPRAAFDLAYAGLGGIAVGLVIGVLVDRVRCWIGRAPTVEATLSLLTPFFAYLPAEHFKMSGVMAVVSVGLYIARRGPRIISAQSRLQSNYMWRMIAFLLEGLIFLLVGLEMPRAFEHLDGHKLPDLALYGALVSATAVAVRLAWMYPGALMARVLRYPFKRHWIPMPTWQAVVFGGCAGIRGGDSLVIALALPYTIPGRGIIIFLTFAVIVVTLVLGGLTLGPLLRWLDMKDDDSHEKEEVEARRRLFAAARGTLDASRSSAALFVRTALDVVKAQREELIKLRDADTIDDEILRKLQNELDLEEVLLESRPTAPPLSKPSSPGKSQ
jgi:CPA1 family monovalent cation:H+ antiporter